MARPPTRAAGNSIHTSVHPRPAKLPISQKRMLRKAPGSKRRMMAVVKACARAPKATPTSKSEGRSAAMRRRQKRSTMAARARLPASAGQVTEVAPAASAATAPNAPPEESPSK